MSISRQNLSVVIVTLKSEHVIHQCIKSINKDILITVIENSGNFKFKDDLETKYQNVNCILSYKNLGMGSGNNLGIKLSKADYVLLLNPDVILEYNTIDQLILASETISDFTILSPISKDNSYPNYKLDNNGKVSNKINLPFKVKSVDGFAMLLNKKKINIIIENESGNDHNNGNYFDENFFMYLENDDLCKRIIKNNENIYIVPKSNIQHLGASAVNKKYNDQIELSRNWHWIWSKFYYNKKHYGFLIAILNGFPTFLSAILKLLFYSLFNKKKKDIYLHRVQGFLSALLGRKSYYRPKINN